MGEAFREFRFGPFRVLRPLGAGGMGETFLAERTFDAEGAPRFAQRVCLKRVLDKHLDGDPNSLRDFQREARLAALLHHPAIVSLLDFGCDDGRWWIAFELVEGLDLRTLLVRLRRAGRRLPIPLVLHITIEIAKALDHAHRCPLPDGTPAGIVHRDLSPANVLLSNDGAVKLSDFGIAKATHAASHPTQTGVMKGKPSYIAPEQVREPQSIDHRADLFALGVCIFEMLTDVRPFQPLGDHDPIVTLLKLEKGERQHDLRTLAPETPERLVELVDRLLENDRHKRLPAASAVLDALAELHVPANVTRSLGQLVREMKSPASMARSERDAHPLVGDVALLPLDVAPHGDDAMRSLDVDVRALVASAVPTSTRTAQGRLAADVVGLPSFPTVPSAAAFEHTPHPEPTPLATESGPKSARIRRWGPLVALTLAGVAVGFVGLLSMTRQRVELAESTRDTQPVAAPHEDTPTRRSAAGPAPLEEFLAHDQATSPEQAAAHPSSVEAQATPPEQAAAQPSSVEALTPTGTQAIPVRARNRARPSDTVAANRTATLNVYVLPVGRVLVDGTLAGDSPVELRVTPGTHVIEAVIDGDRIRESVRLRPGQQRRVVLRLATSPATTR